jgi:hypothetical protein
MFQSDDGRIWLLQQHGLSEMAIEQSSGGATADIVEKHTYRWDSPKNQFENFFYDHAGGIWFGGEGNLISRYQLPLK